MRIALQVGGGRTVRGSERQLLYLAEDLIARGHELYVSCVAGTPVATAFRALGADVTGARPRGDLDLASLAAYCRWLRRVRPHAVLLGSWKRAATAALGARIARVPRIVLRVGGPHGWRGSAGDRLRRRALCRWIDVVWANSAELAEQLLAYAGGGLPHGVHVVPNAVAIAEVAPFPLREALGLGSEEPIVFTAAGLERNKGHDVLLAALAGLPTAVHLVIAGDGPERDALARQAAALGLSERLHLLGHRDDVPALLLSCDAFALATRADSTPNAALEAMAAGVPVVITAVAGSAALLAAHDPEPLGWMVPLEDPAALAVALAQALGPAGPVRAARALTRVRRDHTRAALALRGEALLLDPLP